MSKMQFEGTAKSDNNQNLELHKRNMLQTENKQGGSTSPVKVTAFLDGTGGKPNSGLPASV